MQATRDAWDVFRPGGQLHPQYLLEHKWNFIFEGVLLVVIAYMFLQRSSPKKKADKPLTERVTLQSLTKCWMSTPAAEHVTAPNLWQRSGCQKAAGKLLSLYIVAADVPIQLSH